MGTSCNIFTHLTFVLTLKHVVRTLIRIAEAASALHHSLKTKRDTSVWCSKYRLISCKIVNYQTRAKCRGYSV